MQQVFSDTSFTQLDIPAEVLEGIAAAGYEFCTPVQEEVLPLTLKGDNIAAQSQTGTGKTATFLITLLTRLIRSAASGEKNHSNDSTSRPRALILAPTRELAVQIGNEADILSESTNIRFQAIYGGVDYEKQRMALQYEQVDVVVATPGRLIDYMKQKIIFLDNLEVLVIDEADRMFDMGFIPDVRWLLKRCPSTDKRQSLLFSATLSEKVMELAYEHLNISEATNINPGQITVDKIDQSLFHVGKHEKMSLLFGLLHREKPESSLIFTNTKRMAEILEDYLKANGFEAACLTGDVPQKKRMATLERFKNKKLNILIATDVASRGLHIDAVTHVFNYDLPQDAEDYVHRIGRTARIGATGNAIALAGEEDAFYLEAIEKLAGKIPVIWAEDEDFERNFKRPQRRPQSSPRSTSGRGKPGDSRGRGGSSSSRVKPSRSTGSKYEPKKRRPSSGEQSEQESRQPSRKRNSSSNSNQGETQKSTENRSRRRPPHKRSGGEQTAKGGGAKTAPETNKNVNRKAERTTPKPPVKVQAPEPQKKKGILGKIFGIFKGDNE